MTIFFPATSEVVLQQDFSVHLFVGGKQTAAAEVEELAKLSSFSVSLALSTVPRQFRVILIAAFPPHSRTKSFNQTKTFFCHKPIAIIHLYLWTQNVKTGLLIVVFLTIHYYGQESAGNEINFSMPLPGSNNIVNVPLQFFKDLLRVNAVYAKKNFMVEEGARLVWCGNLGVEIVKESIMICVVQHHF